MKTIVYIDGLNLYYGAINRTSYKWLDVVKLFTHICKTHDLANEIEAVKFFTAPVLGRVARHGADAVTSQNLYHRALETLYPDKFQVIKGYFQVEKRDLPVFETIINEGIVKPIDKTNRVDVWKIEEKKTDVNIALEMFVDAMEGIEQVVLVSNDTDLVPALEKIHRYFSHVKKAVIIPRKETKEYKLRPANNALIKNADWVRCYITENELEHFQLPEKIPTKKRPIYKPSYW